MDKLELTEAQKVIVGNLSAEERKSFDGLKPEMQLAFITRIELRSDVVEGEEFSTGDDELEEVPLLSFATENNPLGIQKGEVIRGRLLGYVNMFSETPKENWEKVIDKQTGKIFYKNGYFKFEGKNGTIFGLRDASALHKLKKIATVATDPLEYQVNPEIAIRYEGKVSKAVAKDKYGIEMSTGKEIHVCTYNLGDAIVLYVKGTVNYLNPPVPQVRVEDTRDEESIAIANYTAQNQANAKAKQMLLESGASAQH